MYQISWTDMAFDGLADLSLVHQDRWSEINSAVDLIEYRLSRKPVEYSHEVSEGLRRIDVRPVAVCFSLDQMSIVIESVGWVA